MRYGYRATSVNGVISALDIGHGIAWNDDGSPLTEKQYWDPIYFKPGGGITLWGTPVLQVVADHSALFGEDVSLLAQEYIEFLESEHTVNQQEPFSEFGRWRAIDII